MNPQSEIDISARDKFWEATEQEEKERVAQEREKREKELKSAEESRSLREVGNLFIYMKD